MNPGPPRGRGRGTAPGNPGLAGFKFPHPGDTIRPQRMSQLFENRPQEGAPTLVAFGGGKGGIGKSLLAANFATALAQAGFPTLVADLDLGGTNLHTLLGMAEPAATLSDFISRRAATLDTVVVPSPIPGLHLLPAAHDDLDAPLLKSTQRDKLLRHLKRAPYAFIVLDLGAGTGAHTLDFFHAADVGVLVTTPEKPAIENAWRFVKALIERQIKKIIPEDHANLRERVRKGEPLSRLLLQETPDLPPELHEILRGLIAPLKLFVAVNQIRSEAHTRLSHQLAAAARKYFPLHLEPLGTVPFDPALHEAVAAGQSLALAQPNGPAWQAISGLAKLLLRHQVAPPRDLMQEIGRPWAAQNPYAFLGLPDHATGGEVELATKRFEAMLAPGSLAIHSLFPVEEIQALAAFARKNRELLLSAARGVIDAKLETERARQLSEGAAPARAVHSEAPAPVPEREPAAAFAVAREAPPVAASAPPQPAPPASLFAAVPAPSRAVAPPTPQSIPPLPVGTVFNGRTLKATREMHGLSLEEVARETKIRRWYFECIEEERVADLPAPVYLKGFLRQFAGILRLDADKVVADYMHKISPPPTAAK